jgi:hypothetical protein
MAAEKNSQENLIFGGYEFLSENDAQKAAMDLSKIKLLESRFKASRPSDKKAVYDKSIENKIFKTPVGWGYLADLRKQLLESGYTEDDLIPIPVNVSMTKHSALENLTVKQRIKPADAPKSFTLRRVFPIILNIVLAILVVLMFVVAATSDSDNILNYKRNITNRYSSWEQDLTEREKAVRQAEKKLGIEDTSSYYEDTDTN